jgi:hypothetical protein
MSDSPEKRHKLLPSVRADFAVACEVELTIRVKGVSPEDREMRDVRVHNDMIAISARFDSRDRKAIEDLVTILCDRAISSVEGWRAMQHDPKFQDFRPEDFFRATREQEDFWPRGT